MEGGTGGNSHQDTFGGAHATARRVGFFLGDGDHFVQERSVQNGGDEIGADALEAVGAGAALGQQGEDAGSTPTIRMLGFCSFRYRPLPVTVPPVPMPATKMSTCPSVSAQISGPVVA